MSISASERQNAMSNNPRKKLKRRYKDLFKGYSFKFEFQGRQPYYAREYEEIVTKLGGEVKEDAVYTIGNEKTYANNKDKKIYQACYILHSIRAKKPLDIELHRWTDEILPKCPNGSTKCYSATSLLKNDSLYRFYDKERFCEPCSKEFKDDSSSDEMDETSPNDNSKVELIDKARIKTEPTEKSNKDTKKAINNKAKSLEMSLSDSDESPRKHKKFKSHTDKIKDLLSTPMFDLHAATKNYYEQNLDSTKNVKVENVVKNPMASTSKLRKMEKKRRTRNDDSHSSLDGFSSDEEVDLEKVQQWWKPQKYSEKQLCQIRSCSLEPEPHLKHGNQMRNLSLQERRIILKYLIQTNNIHAAKGNKVFSEMHDSGYLTHRSTETLRNCLRRRILPNIDEYNLPSCIKEKFQALL